ncbi:MAG: hypothetical protein HOK41_12315 [Nitrospina sp.]|mgnify:CR=1|jgi:hypothetical protein|nr:hypothetical protein [Nitrospina sp.]MBT6718682.1 hypothetical protein [Nitrospina sp.]
MKAPRRNKILTVLLSAILVVAFSNAASAMPHMDSMDCAMKVSCNNCIAQAVFQNAVEKADNIFYSSLQTTRYLYLPPSLTPESPPPKS